MDKNKSLVQFTLNHAQGSGVCGRSLSVPPVLLCLASFLVHSLCLKERWSFTQMLIIGRMAEIGTPPHHSWFLFVLQIYPASLQLLVLAEGEQLILLLKKNEWVLLWVTVILYPYSSWALGQKKLDICYVNHTQSQKIDLRSWLWMMWIMYAREGGVVWVWPMI